jgi:hypothetical protein
VCETGFKPFHHGKEKKKKRRGNTGKLSMSIFIAHKIIKSISLCIYSLKFHSQMHASPYMDGNIKQNIYSCLLSLCFIGKAGGEGKGKRQRRMRGSLWILRLGLPYPAHLFTHTSFPCHRLSKLVQAFQGLSEH